MMFAWLRRWIVKRRVKSFLRRAGASEETVGKIMGGWKTWTAGLLSIATGVATILRTIVDGDYAFDQISEGIALIVAGLGMIGIGHKVEKAKDDLLNGVSVDECGDADWIGHDLLNGVSADECGDADCCDSAECAI